MFSIHRVARVMFDVVQMFDVWHALVQRQRYHTWRVIMPAQIINLFSINYTMALTFCEAEAEWERWNASFKSRHTLRSLDSWISICWQSLVLTIPNEILQIMPWMIMNKGRIKPWRILINCWILRLHGVSRHKEIKINFKMIKWVLGGCVIWNWTIGRQQCQQKLPKVKSYL